MPLNPAQQRAVDTIDGPVMVVAGPGTGKTQVLAERIANILQQTDTNPSSILALTFTESAAKNMRQRLVSLIGKTGYYVQITTFHSFCTGVIQDHPEYFPIDRDSQPLTDLERFALFENIILDSKLETLKPLNAPLFYLREAMKAISDLKREGVTATAFAQLVAAEQTEWHERQAQEKISKTETQRQTKLLAKWSELQTIYEAYQQALRAARRYDFDDMIGLVVEAFQKHELLLREYQENIHYFLVDEYQDTNTAQNVLVDLLTAYWGEAANIFVVGDPNQSIYRFQGASVENALSFIERYPKAEVITLNQGYRCPQPVYDAAAQVISHNTLTAAGAAQADIFASLSQPLESQKQQDSLLQLYTAPSQVVEHIYLAEHIQQLLDENVPPEEIAILYRNNSQAGEIQEVLEKWGIAYEIEGGDNILAEEHIRQLLQLLAVINQIRAGEEPDALYEVMLYDWVAVSNLAVMKVAQAAGKQKVSLWELIRAGYPAYADKAKHQPLTQIEFEVLSQWLEQLENWAVLDSRTIFTQWFEQLLEGSGYLEWVLYQPHKTDLLITLTSLFREIKAMVGQNHQLKLADFLQTITTMQEHGISIRSEDFNITQNAVHLSTVHKAKGREWQHVFLVNLVDGKWGNARSRELIPLPEALLPHTDVSKKEQNEDDRRLFYVGLTRAKTQVHLSYPETIISENRSRETVGSMFIQEVPSDLLTPVTADHVAQKADEYMEKLLRPAQSSVIHTSEKEFFQSVVESFKLSVTALNMYLRDPQEFVDNVLLRVPRSKPEPMAFGTAIHYALEQMYRVYQKTNAWPALKDIQAQYQESLTKELLNSADFDRRLVYGQDILAQYHQEVQHRPANDVLFIERFFGTGWSKTVLDDIPLVGRIDRVDWLSTTDKTVRVIDYKTGSAKSENFIKGTIASAGLSAREQELPESIRGPYKRQLLFYKLLTELDPTFVPTVTEAEFEFVEPDKKTGKFTRRTFTLTDQEVSDLKELIREVMSEIRELKFLE